MTTISNSRRKKRISPLAAILIVVVFLGVGSVFIWRNNAASFLWSILSPVLVDRNQGSTAAGVFLSGFTSNMQLAADNRRLREALASSTVLLLDRNILYAENLDLKSRLGRVPGKPAVLASVLLRPPGVPYDTLIIDVGKNVQIKNGDLVSAGGEAYIGKVAQVYDTTSRVILFSSPGQTYQALLRGTVPISVAGQGSGSMAGELPVGTEVAVGDEILLPAIMPHITAYVSGVVKHSGESFQTVYLQLPVSPFGLQYVEVSSE